MPAAHGGVVVYAKDLPRMSAFYAAVTGFDVVESHPDHVALESGSYSVVVVRIPDHVAITVEIDDPPVRREDTPVKPVIPVAGDFARARSVAARLGGVLDGPDREWNWRAADVCDGHDPEGNVFQLRRSTG